MSEQRKDYSKAEREKLAKQGKAMPDGSFPIVDKEDLKNAIGLAGNASDPGKAKAFIKKRAKALGASDMIPDTWRSEEKPYRPAREIRGWTVDQVEVREGDGGSTLVFDGYGSLTNVPYDVHDYLGVFRETMRSGAFAKTLSEQADVRLLLNHDGLPLARTKSGTLRLSEDSRGLHVGADLDARSSQVSDIRYAMERGDLDQMSIGFKCIRDEWNDDYSQREVAEVALRDVSIVTFPASTQTTATLASSRSAIFLDRTRTALAEGRHVDTSDAQRLADVLDSLRDADMSLGSARAGIENALTLGDEDDTDPTNATGKQNIPNDDGMFHNSDRFLFLTRQAQARR